MPKVRALVFDLNRSAPKAGDAFLVDTNVWFWMTYPGAPDALHASQTYQINDYPSFVKNALVAKATVHWSGLSWPELAHVIEGTEYKIAKISGAIPSHTTLKGYRHDHPAERARVAQHIKDSWSQVESLAIPLNDVVINQQAILTACDEIPTIGIDGYDAFLLQAFRASTATAIVTDDGDFSTIPKIKIYTANPAVLADARRDGRLVKG